MKIKFYGFLVFLLITNVSIAQDSSSFLYQRTFNRLKAKGIPDAEIKSIIKSEDSIYQDFLNKEIENQEKNFNKSVSSEAKATVSCSDIPQSEKDVLQAIYNQLNGTAWAVGWDFNTPVTTWNPSTGQGWYGIYVQNCSVISLSINSNDLQGVIPDLTNLTNLIQLGFSSSFDVYSLTNGPYKILPSSNFSSIGNLQNLTRLNISNADFGGQLPANFVNLSQNIENLYIGRCNLNDTSQLTSIISGYVNLRSLAFVNVYNGLNSYDFSLPLSFSNLTNLEDITFIFSRVNDINVLSSLQSLRQIVFTSNNISSIPNLSPHTNLKNLVLNNNIINGLIPNYFQQKTFSLLQLENNNFQGTIPSLTFETPNINYNRFYFNNNFFRFKDFANEFNTYNSLNNISHFRFSPQSKTDSVLNLSVELGQIVTLTMCEDGNFLLDDTFTWYKGIYPDLSDPQTAEISGINGGNSYTFTVTGANIGNYFCISKHHNPAITNNSSDQFKNLTLVRNQITLNIFEPCVNCISFDLLKGEKYLVSGWAKEANAQGVNSNNISYTKSNITISFVDVNGTLINAPLKFYPSGAIIDGWQRILGEFVVPSTVDDMNLELVNEGTLDSFFDDIRIIPSKGNMKSFVYDQKTQRLMAELDENNYATFYEYDLEGGLIRVKKETEKGIYTIQETRSSTRKN